MIILRAIFLIFLFLTSCSDSTNRALRQEIDGKGILKLDNTNPYLAPNAFLKEEAKNSEVLKGFLALKGNPISLEYEQGLLGGHELTLLYENQESYKLKKSSGDWIINSAGFQESENRNLNSNTPLFENSLLDNKIIEKKLEGEASIVNTNKDSDKNSTLDDAPNKNQIVIASDKYHTIEFGNQNMKFISFWYTGSELNADRIARINSINEQEPLQIGQKIRIPSYLLKREENPSYTDLEAYLKK